MTKIQAVAIGLLVMVGFLSWVRLVDGNSSDQDFTRLDTAMAGIVVAAVLSIAGEAFLKRKKHWARVELLNKLFYANSAKEGMMILKRKGWPTPLDDRFFVVKKAMERGDKVKLRQMPFSHLDRWLQAAVLSELNLSARKLCYGNFKRAKLIKTLAHDTDFSYATFEEADLSGASLVRSLFVDANFRNAKLVGTILTDAALEGADLRGADLTDVKFLRSASFSGSTILPDGERWSPRLHSGYLLRFTDPTHSDYWKPVRYEEPDVMGMLFDN